MISVCTEMVGEVVVECTVLLPWIENENELHSWKLLRSYLLEWLEQSNMVWQSIGDSISSPVIHVTSI